MRPFWQVDGTACPVCRFPIQASGDATPCPQCRWPWPTRAAATDGLDRAQRDWDLRAAHLAAAGDESVFNALLPILRGPLPTHDEILDSGQSTYVGYGNPPDSAEAVATAQLLRAVVGGDLRAIAFLSIGPDGMELNVAVANPTGTPTLVGAPRHWDWSVLIPGLPTTSSLRRFHLAGGVGWDGGTDPLASMAAATANLPDLRLPRGSALVITTGPSSWHVLGRIADAASVYYQAAVVLRHSTVLTDDVADQLIRQAPLTKAYELVLLQPDEHGVNHLSPRRIFGPDANGLSEAQIDVYAPAGVLGSVALPVVVSDHGAPPTTWTPVRLIRAPLPRGLRTTLRVALDRASNVVFPDLPHAEAESRSWSELLAAVPRQLQPIRSDIVFAVELVAGEEAQDRLDLVRDAVEAITAEAWSTDLVRVGLIGYGQHTTGQGEPVMVVPLGRPADAAAAVRGWRLRHNRSDFAAAIEDALAAAARQAWRDGVTGVLVSVGSRPPYPLRQGEDRARPCVAQLDWQRELARVEARGVERVAVWSDPAWVGLTAIDTAILSRTQNAWSALGAGIRLDAGKVSVEGLLRAIGATFVNSTTPFAYPVRPHATSTTDRWRSP